MTQLVLLGRRLDAKGITDLMTASQKQKVLQVLALHLMEKEQRSFTLSEAATVIANTLADTVGQMDGGTFLKQVEVNSGLVVERERNQYELVYLSIQEYLAASALADDGRKPEDHMMQKGWWLETMCLYSVMQSADRVVAIALEVKTVETLSLAHECPTEGAPVKFRHLISIHG